MLTFGVPVLLNGTRTILWGDMAQIDGRNMERIRCTNELDRPAVDRGEGRAQNFMPPHDLGECPLEHVRIQSTLDPDGPRHVVRGTARVELVDEPDALLRIGQLKGTIAARRFDQGNLHSCLLSGLDPQRQSRHRRRLEYLFDRQFHADGFWNPRRELGRQQGLPSDLEKVFVYADRRGAEEFLPEAA